MTNKDGCKIGIVLFSEITKDLYILRQMVVYTITLKEKIISPGHSKNWDLGERLKLPQTMLHPEYKVKQGLHRENVSRRQDYYIPVTVRMH